MKSSRKYKKIRDFRLPPRSRTAHFWAITRRVVIIQGSLTLEDGTDKFSPNVAKDLPLLAALIAQKSAILVRKYSRFIQRLSISDLSLACRCPKPHVILPTFPAPFFPSNILAPVRRWRRRGEGAAPYRRLQATIKPKHTSRIHNDHNRKISGLGNKGNRKYILNVQPLSGKQHTEMNADVCREMWRCSILLYSHATVISVRCV